MFPKIKHRRIGEASKPGPTVNCCLDEEDVDDNPPALMDDFMCEEFDTPFVEPINEFTDAAEEQEAPEESIDDNKRVIKETEGCPTSPRPSLPTPARFRNPPQGDSNQQSAQPQQSPTVIKLSEHLPKLSSTVKNKRRKAKRKIAGTMLESINSTSWAALLERLKTSQADVIFAQETRTIASMVNERSAIAKKLGWKSLWAPAKATNEASPDDERSTSGGVAIFVRAHLGLSKLDENLSEVIVDARVVGGKLTVPGSGPIAIYSVYMVTGVGLNHDNREILNQITLDHNLHGLAWAMGGDWNMEPKELLESGIGKATNSKTMYPDVETCVAPACVRTIDYFIIEKSLANAFNHPITIEDAGTRPHRPVTTTMKGGLKALKKEIFKPVPKLPFEPMIGPVKEPPSYAIPRQLIVQAKEQLSAGNHQVARHLYGRAFAEWATLSEIEVANANDLATPGAKSRREEPERIRVPLVPNLTSSGKDPPRATTLSNLTQKTQEISAVLTKAWSHGNEFWIKLKETVGRVKRGIDDIAGNDCEEEKKAVKDYCDEIENFNELIFSKGCATNAYQDAWADYARCTVSAAHLRKTLTKETTAARNKAKEEANKAWEEWKIKDMEGSASASHRFTKLPSKWLPPDIFDKEGERIVDNKGILEAEAEKYKALWKAIDAEPKVVYANNEPCPLLAPAQLRRISKAFKRKTKFSPDGWHPRHFALLSDQALEILALIYEFLEITGHMPDQQRFVCIFLLDKPSGGTRPIGLFNAVYRIWSKARQGIAASWAAKFDRPYFAAGKNRSTLDPVWRQSVLNQMARCNGTHIAALGWDLRKFYESLDHGRLRAQAELLGFPLSIIDVAINAYKMKRIVTYEDLPGPGVYPTQGIIAGDSLSDILIKLYYVSALDELVQDLGADLEVYFDDLQLIMRGSFGDILNNLPVAAEKLKKVIEQDLRAKLAIDKATLVSDSSDLCKELRDAIGAEAGPIVEMSQFLGIDNQLGKSRATIMKASKLKARMQAAAERGPRLRRLRTKTRTSATKVFTTGTLAAATYGSEALGLSNNDLEKLRKLALDAMPALAKGRSRSAIFSALGDPTWRAAVAPARRWAQEIWEADLPRESAVESLSLEQLEQAWLQAKASPPKDWGGCRGATDAAILSLKRFGWSMSNHMTFVSDLGVAVPIRETSPKLLAKMLQEGVQRSWERKLAKSMASEGWVGERVSADAIRKVLNSAWAKRNPRGARGALKLFCGAVWTQERAVKSGYVVEDQLCPLCRKAPDTIQHRICECHEAEETRSKHKWAFKQIRALMAKDPCKAFRGVWEHPAKFTSLPAKEGNTVTVWGDTIPEEERKDEELGGHLLFTDGSASRHPVAELRRASWCAAFFNQEGKLQASIRGPVWRHLPQTPQAGEYLGAMAGLQLMHKRTHMVGDCLGVINSINKLAMNPRPSGVHGGLLKEAIRDNNLGNLIKATWMPSHQTLKNNATPEEILWHMGNKQADEDAGQARADAEEEANLEILKDAEVECNMICRMLKAAGEVVALWPPLPRSVARACSNAKGSLSVTHQWRYVKERGYWRCTGCGVFTHGSLQDGPPSGGGPCRPGRMAEKMIEAERLGHRLAGATLKGVPTIFCVHCAVHGSWQWRQLLTQCRGHPSTSQSDYWLTKVLRGEDPTVVKNPRQKATKKSPKELRKRPALTKEVKVPNPLRNKMDATIEDKVRWSTIANGICLEDVVVGSPAQATEVEQTPKQESDKAQVQEEEVEQQLPMLPENSEEVEVDCPRCAATVLATDAQCAQCGLERAVQEQPRASRRGTPSTETSKSNPNTTEPKSDLSQSGMEAMLEPGPRWHGGTLAPPPFLAADFERRPRQEEQASEAAKRRRLWNADTAAARGSGTKRSLSNSAGGPEKRSRQDGHLGEEGRPEGDAATPSPAQLRIAAVHSRVRARLRGQA